VFGLGMHNGVSSKKNSSKVVTRNIWCWKRDAQFLNQIGNPFDLCKGSDNASIFGFSCTAEDCLLLIGRLGNKIGSEEHSITRDGLTIIWIRPPVSIDKGDNGEMR